MSGAISAVATAVSGISAATGLGIAGLGLTAASDFGLFGGNKSAGTPAAPPAPPPSAAPASLAETASSQSVQQARMRALGGVGAAGGGFDSTVATSPLGTNGSPNTAKAGLLGTS